MNTTVKMTQKDFFNEIIALAETNDRLDIVEFARGRIEVLDKKVANKKKPTAVVERDNAIKAVMLEVLDIEGKTVTEIQKMVLAIDESMDISNQKASALLRALKDEGKVTRFTEGKKTFFKLV